MSEDIIIEPMTEEYLLWRCLHDGPLSCTTLHQWPSDSDFPWERYHRRTVPLLQKRTHIYVACAIIARD